MWTWHQPFLENPFAWHALKIVRSLISRAGSKIFARCMVCFMVVWCVAVSFRKKKRNMCDSLYCLWRYWVHVSGMEEGRYDGSKRCNLSLAGVARMIRFKSRRGVSFGGLWPRWSYIVVQATRDTHSEANTNANGMNKALSGPFLVSRTGDVGSTKRRVKVPKWHAHSRFQQKVLVHIDSRTVVMEVEIR